MTRWSAFGLALAVTVGLGCGRRQPPRDPCAKQRQTGGYRFVSEVKQGDQCLQRMDWRVSGTLVPGSHVTRPGPDGRAEHRLELEHGGKRLIVHYRGAPPANLRPGARVVAEGRLQGGVFVARTVLTRCPSRYGPRPR